MRQPKQFERKAHLSSAEQAILGQLYARHVVLTGCDASARAWKDWVERKYKNAKYAMQCWDAVLSWHVHDYDPAVLKDTGWRCLPRWNQLPGTSMWMDNRPGWRERDSERYNVVQTILDDEGRPCGLRR